MQNQQVNQSRRLIVTALLFTVFMAALEATVVATAMPTVVRDLGGLRLYSWVFSLYMLTSTITVPIYGKLADVFGRKKLLQLGLLLFLIGSVGAAYSPSMEILIAFRALQGLGAGAMQPLAMTIIGDLFRIEERARVQAATGAVWGLAGTAGPFFGSLIIEWLGWPWVFLINVPFAILAMVILQISYKERVQRKAGVPLDWAGAVCMTLFVLALLGAGTDLEQAKLLLAVSVVLLAVFIWIERRARDPLLPPDLFNSRFVATASILAVLTGATMMPVVSYLPLVVQGVLNGTPRDAGLTIMPMMVSWPVAAYAAGRMLVKIGAKPLIVAGCLTTGAAGVLLGWAVAAHASMLVLGIATGVLGVGLGMMSSAVIVSLQESVSWERRGVATASQMFFRTMGGSLVVGVLGGLIASEITSHPGLPAELAGELLGPDHGSALAPAMLATASTALDQGLTTAFYVIAVLAVLAAVTCVFYPKQGKVAVTGGLPQMH